MKSQYLKVYLLAALVCVLSFIANAQNSEYARASLWEKEIAAFAENDRQAFPKKGATVFVGSSSIRGWKTLAEDFPDLKVLNRGFGGSHLEDVNFYAPQIVLPYKPKLIVLYAGENDLTAGKTVERVFADFKRFVELVRKGSPKTRIIFVSIKPSPARAAHFDKFRAANALIKAETEKDKRLSFIDVWQAMSDSEGNPKKEIFLNDGIHMNSEGYKIWREILMPHIKLGLRKNFSRTA